MPVHRELAPAKLTRELHVVGRRDDGYHLLDAEMVTLDLADELEFAPGEGLEVVDEVDWGPGRLVAPGLNREEAGPVAAVVPVDGSNLVLRALDLVGRQARVRLRKRIPAGAGLGGGSADAAAVLRWAGERRTEVAAQLGADVPFCLVGGRARVTGIGEHLAELPQEDHEVLLVTPPLAVSTPAVYAAFDEVGGGNDAQNDLERAALAVEPRLRRWRDFLAEVVGARPVLAGSGSTYFVECQGQGPELERLVREAVTEVGARALVRLCRTAEWR